MLLYIEPVTLIGEGKYNLDVLKEIDGKESYLGLDSSVIKCQSVEAEQKCTTRHYKETFLNVCGCLPLKLWAGKNMQVSNILNRIKNNLN